MFSLKTLSVALVLAVSSSLIACAPASTDSEEEQGSSEEALLQQDHKDNDTKGAAPITVIAIAKVKPETRADFEAAAFKLVAGTRREKGNLSYTMLESKDDATEFVFVEKWTNQAAIDAHMNGPVLGTFFTRVQADFEPGYPQIKTLDAVEPPTTSGKAQAGR